MIELKLTPGFTSNASAFYTTRFCATTTSPCCLLGNWGHGKCGRKAKVHSQIGWLGQVTPVTEIRVYSKRSTAKGEIRSERVEVSFEHLEDLWAIHSKTSNRLTKRFALRREKSGLEMRFETHQGRWNSLGKMRRRFLGLESCDTNLVKNGPKKTEQRDGQFGRKAWKWCH